MFRKIARLFKSMEYYVIMDPEDNSITFSKKLFRHIKDNNKGSDKATAFVFRETCSTEFGFMVNPDLDAKKAHLCAIQYNDKLKCIGFESLKPSVTYMLYEYGIGNVKTKLSVSVRHTAVGQTFYSFDKPTKPCRKI